MNIFLDTSNFDHAHENLIEYLISIKENLNYEKLYISSSNKQISETEIKEFKLHFNTNDKNDCDVEIKFKFGDINNIESKKKFSFFFNLNDIGWKYRLQTSCINSYKLLDFDYESVVFNRLGATNKDEIYMFPYSFLFRCTGLGRIDKYGFRSRGIQNSKKKIINISLLGGSACWGFSNVYSKTFGQLLEKKLNLYLRNKNDDREVVVSNFGQHSYLVLDQLITYVLHIKNTNPDIVILHDGFNDLMFGMITDRNLIKDKISYALTLENMCQKVNLSNVALTQNDVLRYNCINKPDDIINAYITQKNNLMDIIISSGKTKVISALQPFLLSKSFLSEEERMYLEKTKALEKGQYAEPYNSVRYMYDYFILNKCDHTLDINFDKEFSNIKKTCFVDFCHTNNFGEEIISDIYFHKVKKIV